MANGGSLAGGWLASLAKRQLAFSSGWKYLAISNAASFWLVAKWQLAYLLANVLASWLALAGLRLAGWLVAWRLAGVHHATAYGKCASS